MAAAAAAPPPPPQPGLPSSLTLLSLSSVSDCNSTRSLLHAADSEELLACRPAKASGRAQQAPPLPLPLPPPTPPAFQPRLNPLVNTHLESFKRNPRQSLTPTHLPSAPSAARCLRRTPSDGAIKKNLQPLPERGPWDAAGTGL